MWYWNKTNFEGLEEIAAEASKLPHLGDFARYCQLRASGLRKQAMLALRAFLTHTSSLTFGDKREIVRWLLEAHWRAPGIHQLLPYPAVKELIEPTLTQWIKSHPEDGAAHRLAGCFLGDEKALLKAIEIDESDSVARLSLASRMMRRIEYATHHLSESIFLGDESEAINALDEIQGHLNKLPEGERRDSFQSEVSEERQLVLDWVQYKTNPTGSFPQWCADHGKLYRWPSIVYYSK